MGRRSLGDEQQTHTRCNLIQIYGAELTMERLGSIDAWNDASPELSFEEAFSAAPEYATSARRSWSLVRWTLGTTRGSYDPSRGTALNTRVCSASGQKVEISQQSEQCFWHVANRFPFMLSGVLSLFCLLLIP